MCAVCVCASAFGDFGPEVHAMWEYVSKEKCQTEDEDEKKGGDLLQCFTMEGCM
jgi:hypothetical protein